MSNELNFTSKDYFRQNIVKIDWRLEPVLKQLVPVISKYKKDKISLLLIESMEVSHKSVSWLKFSLKSIFPEKTFIFKELPYKSNFSDLPNNNRGLEPITSSFFTDPVQMGKDSQKYDVIIDIFTLHELLDTNSSNNIFLALKNLKSILLESNGTLLILDGIQSFNPSEKEKAVSIRVRSDILVQILTVFKSPNYAYLPVDFANINTNVNKGDILQLTLPQLNALTTSYKYVLKAIEESSAFNTRLNTVIKKLGLSDSEELINALKSDLKLVRKLKLYFKEEDIARLSRLKSSSTIDLFIDRWRDLERFKIFYYYSYSDWHKVSKELGFSQIRINLIENEENDQALDDLLEILKPDVFVYGDIRRGKPFGHCIITVS